MTAQLNIDEAFEATFTSTAHSIIVFRLYHSQPTKMAIFPSRKFVSSSQSNTIASKYRALLARHPFALFGFPFIAVMLAGSFFLTPATALRYERHDRKVRQMTKGEELGIGKEKRRIDLKEEYYVSWGGDNGVWESGVLT